MTLFDLKVHHHEKLKDNTSQIIKMTPYCRMSDGNTGQKLYLRDGKAWSEDGKVIKPTPEWAIDRLKVANPIVVKQCGFSYLIPEKKTDMELSLKERMMISVKKGIVSIEEYDEMYSDVEPEELKIEVDESSSCSLTQPDPPPQEDFSSMKRPALIKACKENGLKWSMKLKNVELVELLNTG